MQQGHNFRTTSDAGFTPRPRRPRRVRSWTQAVVSCLAVLVLLSAGAKAVRAGSIVVSNDEWVLTDIGFAEAADTSTFALNVASFFTGGDSGNLLAYSSDFGLVGASLASTMTGAGHTWTVDTFVTFDVATLLGYDAVYLSGPVNGVPDNQVLIDYVEAGGNVYLAAGTNDFVGGPGPWYSGPEAAAWNTFLNHFGLAYDGSAYNLVIGSIAIDSDHPIFFGVDTLYQNNGNSVSDLAWLDGSQEVLVHSGNHGLFGVYEPVHAPEPTTLILFGTGLTALFGYARRKRKRS